MTKEIRKYFVNLEKLLIRNGYQLHSSFIKNGLRLEGEAFTRFINSNQIWGGSGSIIDAAFADSKFKKESEEDKNTFFSLMIEHGVDMNPRIKTHLDFFTK